MSKRLKIILIWTFVSIIWIILLIFSILFYTYKSYSKFIDEKELDKFSLTTKLTETANIITQGLKERHVYKNYIYSLDIMPDYFVLDFGTGLGNDAVHIAERLSDNGHLTCLDIDKLSLDIAKKRLEKDKNVSLICGDIRQIDIPENSYDAIVIYYVLHCIDNEILESTNKKLFYVLKKGGRLYLREPLPTSLGHNDHLLSIEKIDTLMTKSGFKKVSTYISDNIDGVYQK